MESCRRVIDPELRQTWVPADFLAQHDVQAWRDLHMWVDSDSDISGSLAWSSEKAMADGLTIRPIDETVRDTLAWFRSLPEERQSNLRTRMTSEREAEVLQAWHESRA